MDHEISPALDATEQSLLGAAIASQEMLSKICATLRDTDFRPGWPRHIFHAINSEIEDNSEVEIYSLARRIENNKKIDQPLDFVQQIVGMASTPDNIDGHIRIALEAAVSRNIGVLSKKLMKDTTQAATITAAIHQEQSRLFVQKKSSQIGAIAARCIEQIEKLHSLPDDEMSGLATGWSDIDEVTNGLQPGDLVIAAGRPSMGKSMFGQNIAEHCAIKLGQPALIVSCEMGDTQFANRIIASQGRLPLQMLKTPKKMSEDEWSKLSYALSKIHEAPLYIEDTTDFSNTAAIRYRAEEIKRAHGKIGVIVVDYLQLLKGSGRYDRKDLEIADISRELKFIAKDLETVVVALSQLSRKVEERTDKRPLMSDLRESGAIEQDADVIFMLYRDEYYKADSPDKGIAEVSIPKHRNGEAGRVFRLAFLGEYQRFENLAFGQGESPNTGNNGKKHGPSF